MLLLYMETMRDFVERYDREHPVRTADVHNQQCLCERCAVDLMRMTVETYFRMREAVEKKEA